MRSRVETSPLVHLWVAGVLVFAPACGTSCRPTPKTTAQPTNSIPKNHLPFGPVMRFAQRDRPSEAMAAFAKITTNTTATVTEMMKAGRLFGKFSNQRVKIVTL